MTTVEECTCADEVCGCYAGTLPLECPSGPTLSGPWHACKDPPKIFTVAHKSISTLQRWRDLASPITWPWRKTYPTSLQSRGLDCHGFSNFRLHSLSSRVSVARAAPTFWGFIHLRFSESCHFWETGALQGIFFIVFRVEEPVCK